jgi:alkanesulfonate monooxygenase SsuD/methylene tetrahydromethanopterin reductase-like flavin-dependent oxidoreductase (luciferase family)
MSCLQDNAAVDQNHPVPSSALTVGGAAHNYASRGPLVAAADTGSPVGGSLMDIGIGLPVLCPAPELSVTAWARCAEERGFTSLGTIDRLVYDCYEPFTELAVAAGATSSIRLTTVVLLAPLRANHALFAKSAATLDRLSRSRLVLGLAPSSREDDYTAGGVDFRRRGKLLDALVERAVRQWERPGDGTGPARPRPAARRCCSAGPAKPPCAG